MISLENIEQTIIPMNEFRLKWRFTEEDYDKLPQDHLDQIMPLNQIGSKYLWDLIANLGIHDHSPFRKDYFKNIENAKILVNNEKEIRKWLYKKGFPFNKKVYLSWQSDEAVITNWKILIKYFDSFYYGGSDDLTVIDKSINWALLFYHEDEIYFGTNEKYKPENQFENIEFILT